MIIENPVNIVEQQNNINLNIISEVKSIRSGSKQNFICGVELELENKFRQERQPVDILCLIDNSGSMSGKKAHLVRKSLKFLLKILNQEDQVSLVSFDSRPQVLCPFVKNNDENKQQLKKGIKKITGSGSTLVIPGFKEALKLLKKREVQREQTFILLLTDGEFEDTKEIHKKMSDIVNTYEMQNKFYIFTYGYGDETNPEILQDIAQRYQGKYHLISNVQQVTDWFLLSISSILNCACKDIVIKLKEVKPELISIKQTIGGELIWKNQNFIDRNFEIHIPILIPGDKKIFVFECSFDSEFEINDVNRFQVFLQAELTYNQFQREGIKKQQSMSSDLQIEFLPPNKNLNSQMDLESNENGREEEADSIANSAESYYENLIVTFYRGLGGKAIKQSSELMQNQKDFVEAKKILNQYKENLQSKCKFLENEGMKHLLEDIEEAIEKCHPQKFYRGHFQKMNAVHERRSRSRSHSEDWNEDNRETLGNYRGGKIVLSDSDSDSKSRSGSSDSDSDSRSSISASRSLSSSDSQRGQRRISGRRNRTYRRQNKSRRYQARRSNRRSPSRRRSSSQSSDSDSNNYQRTNRFRNNNRWSNQNGTQDRRGNQTYQSRRQQKIKKISYSSDSLHFTTESSSDSRFSNSSNLDRSNSPSQKSFNSNSTNNSFDSQYSISYNRRSASRGRSESASRERKGYNNSNNRRNQDRDQRINNRRKDSRSRSCQRSRSPHTSNHRGQQDRRSYTQFDRR